MENKNEIAMDIITKLAVTQIAKQENKNPEEVLTDFMKSNTAKMLYDDRTKLWWDGPASVAESYLQEVEELA